MTQRGPFVLATVVAVLVVVAVHFVDFPGSVPRFQKVSGGGVLLDASPSFSVDETYERLADYGEEGRKSYSFRNVTVDLLLPVSVLPFLFLLARRALAPMQGQRLLLALVLSFPFAYVFFDFAENAVVLVLLNTYPERKDALAAILPYVTSVKRVASLLAIVVPFSILGVRKLRRSVPRLTT